MILLKHLKLLCLCPVVVLCSSQPLQAQHYNVRLPYYDSISPTEYVYTLQGEIQFTDSTELRYELLDHSTPPQVIFSGKHHFSDSTQQTIPDFTYDPVTEEYSFSPGTYTEKLLIHFWLVIAGEVKYEIFYEN